MRSASIVSSSRVQSGLLFAWAAGAAGARVCCSCLSITCCPGIACLCGGGERRYCRSGCRRAAIFGRVRERGTIGRCGWAPTWGDWGRGSIGSCSRVFTFWCLRGPGTFGCGGWACAFEGDSRGGTIGCGCGCSASTLEDGWSDPSGTPAGLRACLRAERYFSKVS